jgi:protochlorophyllide reductase
MRNWTKNDIPNLNGKVFIVTGANSGLGYETSLALAEKEALVIMACRNLEKAHHSFETIKAAVPSANLELMELDLAKLQSIRTFAKSFSSKYDKLDVLINNAASTLPPRSVTEDGFEMQFGVNHLGHFAMTGLLLNSLVNTQASRVVTVSSREHVTGLIDWDDLMSEHSYERFAAYRQSKLANLLFAFELQRRFETGRVPTISVAAHPGTASTNWPDNLSGVERIFFRIMIRVFTQSASMGALSVLYAAVDSKVNPGGYYGPEHDKKGHPIEVQAGESAYDDADAKKLWDLSGKLTGVNYEVLNS